jgi:hypothetical protein
LFTHLDFKVWIKGEMFRLIRAIFQGERIKNADVFALFPPAIRFFSDVAEIVGLNRVPLEQAVLCSDGLDYSGTKVGKMQERMQAVCAILNSLACPDIEKLVP